jgi:mRNA interferase YafQ
MLEILYTGRFKKDFKLNKKRSKDLGKLEVVISLLVEEKALPARYKDHALVGNYVGRRECHIESDWLLIYKLDGKCIIFERTGTHTDLFQ